MKEKVYKFLKINKVWIFFILAVTLKPILFEYKSFYVSQIQILIIYSCIVLLYACIILVYKYLLKRNSKK
ncbi:hypothetical protein [Clostridium saccharobutylicum]|uniref:hypothetical protein n=1 Tax=Clostridium saccharobutylicum TaxID=169679 RepID=UPI0005A28359|nr:hypothetical protein [Clostridium saccharobutylicum]AQR92004.1 hypothetical protein CLOSC_37320 [Clostridium saccharobutylicum]AQS01906.1 hypothetical protein CSACC_37370 [Clostridium saccharobutylicum]AQS11506.1 hypothetical protein CLOBY_36620 [Clostridium saccharobutylicum]AQS15889.1 hypothetical protein CLOSACC_37370 [Clostridium saccharobutylicum]MBA2903498.1 hypothetical protein [Clostridium saccharobutylicum]